VCVTASNSCGTSPAQCLAITVGAAPVSPGAITGSNPICPNTTNTYSIATVTGATSYTWTVPAGWVINSGQGTTSISATSGSSGGNICVTASNGCGTSAAQCTNITMNTNSTAPTSISATTNPTCGGSTTLTVIGGSLGTGATWNWFTGSCGGTPVGTGTSITVTPGTTTTYFVRAQGTCGNTTCASITITVNTNSTAATSINASTNPTCGGSTTLSVVGGSLGTGATWNWYSGSCGGTLVGTGNSITVTPATTTTYFVQAIGTCNTTTCTSVTITVNTPSTAPTSATANPSTICIGNSTTLTVNGGSLGTGAQWQWFSGSCGGTAVGTGASITVSPTSTTTYFVRAAGTCNTTTCVSVTVTVDLNPATSNAGPNQSVCGLTATLAGNTPSLGTGTWTQVSGPGTITFGNINSPSSSATASTFGTYVLQWTINNGTCSTSSTVSITFDEMPIPAAAGNDAAVCGLTINLNGNTPNVGSGAWAMVSGPGTITFSNASSATSSATASVYGTYTLSWTFTNGACSNTDNVVVTFDEMPNTSNAGSDDAICGLTLTLNGNAANIGTANWSQLSGPGTLTFSNSSLNTSSVTASAYGTYSASWTIVNGVCSTTDNVSLTFDEMPNAANAGLNDSICGLITNLGGTQTNIGVSTWSQLSGPGTTTFTNPNQHTSGISVTTSGLYEYVLTIVNGTCVTSDTVSHHFFDAPTPVDAGADTAVCALNLNLNAQTPSLGNGIWTQISGPVSASISNPTNINSLFDATQYGNYTLVWTVINGVCTLTDTVNVRLDQTPSTALAGIDTTICTNDYILDGNIPAVGFGVWSTTTAGISMSDSTSNQNYLSSLAVGVNTLVWTISNGVCPSSSDTLEITVNPSSIIPDFRTDTNEIYAYQIVKFIDLSSGNPDSWHWNFGDGDTSRIQNPGHIYTDIGIYPVMLVITNALGCRDTIIKDIEVKERFLVPNIFTPNNDGINDVFKVLASGYKDFSMLIYNRFGQLIFESFNPTIGWNGKTAAGLDVTVGTYFYIIKAVAPDGKEVIEKGPLQLLR
jgi:gliding motility-associated-like protein